MNRTLRPQNLRLALRLDSGLAIGTIYPLDTGRNIIGRSVEVSVPVDDVKVSRVHAAVDQQNGFHYLVDLGSTNGTFLNGSRVQNSAMISIGDQLRVGSAVFVVDLLDHAKNQVGKSWKEPTRAILRAEISGETPEPSKAYSEIGSDARSESDSLIEPLRHENVGSFWKKTGMRREEFLSRHGRWMTLAISAVLVLAAIASTFISRS